MKQSIPKNLVLIGGGHSHAIALRLFGLNPLPGVNLTLITDCSHTPYSGMLPGHVAGFYNFDECHIDLPHLCQFAQAQIYIDRAIGLDLENHRVLCADRPAVTFNLLSIDIGSTPAKISVPGAADTRYAIPAKPVPQFLQAWNQLVSEVTTEGTKPIIIDIVGGGAGGVELALTMQQRLRKVIGRENVKIHLFHRSRELMNSHNLWVRQRLEKILLQRGIQLHLQENVCEVKSGGVRCESGLTVECDRIFWVTQASAPSWLGESGLTTDSKGFILVEDTLQSVSHRQVFAAGDIATMKNYQRPKAGVFAVRQGKPLFENLQQMLLGKSLKPYRPQQEILGLIGTGDGRAIASRGNWGCGPSKLLWVWKDYIDRKFMRLFGDLPRT
ncbi:MAG: FAD-dependent oxidoreductase [Hormoscilla sp. GM102CHS1]|nr:FAD-dependent oxidoreductase [Hormoscilla sp. GM102CHS1]